MSRSVRTMLFVCVALASIATLLPAITAAETRTNDAPACEANIVNYNPGNGEDIVVPTGFKVERLSKKDLNFPTGIAFIGSKTDFKVLVLESGHGLPSRCNENDAMAGRDKFSATNAFTPDIVMLDKNGNKVSGPIAKPTASGDGFQPDGPAIDIGFEKKFHAGRLFPTDSNQGLRTAGRNNSSRIVIVDIASGHRGPFLTGLPAGHHTRDHQPLEA